MSNTVTVYPYSPNINSISSTITIGAGGGGGSSGQYYTTSGTSTVWSNPLLSTTSINANLIISGKKPTLSTDMNKIDIDEMAGIIATLRDVFFILPKHQKLIDENPTLKDAWEQYETVLRKNLNDPELKEVYNQYKTLEALLKEEEK